MAATNETNITELVRAALDELNRQRPSNDQLPTDENTPLSGPGAKLDSLGLITLIVSLEEKISSRFGVTVSLSDAALMQTDNSPLATVGSLIRFLENELGGSHA